MWDGDERRWSAEEGRADAGPQISTEGERVREEEEAAGDAEDG